MSSDQKIMHPAQPLYQEFRELQRTASEMHRKGDSDKGVEYAQRASMNFAIAALQGHPTAVRLFNALSKAQAAIVPVVSPDFKIEEVPFRIKLGDMTLPPLTPYPPLPSP